MMTARARAAAAWLALLLTIAATCPVHAAQESVAPIPPSERTLPTVTANRPVVVTGAALDLEGPVFDRDGTLFFSDVQGGRVLRMEPNGHITPIATLHGLMPGGLAIARDGRIFVAAGNGEGGGAIVAMRPDGSDIEAVVPESAGFFPNDLVFNAAGGFYFTDSRGHPGDPAGGAFYVQPGGGPPVPVLPHLAVANGVALSPDGRRLWIGEYAAGRLYRLDLSDPTTMRPFGAGVAYHFTGLAPDSMRVDADGHVYVALYGQGRMLIFSPSGIPIGQILLPGRDAGRNLYLTSMAIQPGSRTMAIVTSDGRLGGKATIFRARAWGDGLPAPTP